MSRYARVLGVAVAVVGIAVLAAGCGDSRSVLYSGVSPELGGPPRLITDAEARSDTRLIRTMWFSNLEGIQQEGPTLQFRPVSATQFRSRVAQVARRYGFTVKHIQFTNKGQMAPLVVVQTGAYLAFARATRAIEMSLDPHTGTHDRTGWAFSGFFLEAQDERGVPFLVVHNSTSGGGGQWARSDRLYPFNHG